MKVYQRKRNPYLEQDTLFLRGKKIIVNQTPLSKLWYIAKFVLFQNIAKKNIRFLLDQEKIRPPRNLAQLSIWINGLGILVIETQLNSLKIKWIQRLLNPTNALWKNVMVYHQLNLILNYNKGLALLRQKQIVRATIHKHIKTEQ